ncbi:cytochrome P450 [Dacryopinax primogenitus]|uniref:Cytochrome P450 n=1 Tax=Dacryopinax primogenitus (strain DJM 731) TaxID=1858805 RepID=M5FTV1_DACPD|nr:cytochrome P450 [Dacryopinax primogenitus]EJT98884.1 cytochrome P450 [Dacryopinax primogenitus]
MIVAVLLLVSAVALVAITRDIYRKWTSRLPPGPKGSVLVGNLFQVPATFLHRKLHEWSLKHGSLYTIWMGSQAYVVVNSVQVAADIFDRMSGTTSERPMMIKGRQFYVRDLLLQTQGHTLQWRANRRAVHANMNIRAASRFHPMQEHDAAYFALGLIQYPEKKYDKHCHRFATSMISGALYGKRIDHKDDSRLLHKIEEMTQRLMEALMPQNSVVDTLPFLEPVIRRVKWFRKQSDDWHEEATMEGFRLYNAANETDSWGAITTVQDFETNREKYGLSRDDAMWDTLALYMAGQETTHTVMRIFALAMLHNPAVMRTAQRQLDAICENRTPTFEDRPKLPYIEAVALEAARWRAPVPTSVLHAASAEFVYEGYTIPKDTILVDNLWSQTRDASVYPDPEAFNPSRYLDQTTGTLLPPTADTHLSLLAFGHGRRVCPGRDFALNSVFIACAYLLWAFDFSWPVDEHGNEIKCGVDEMVDHAIVVTPRPFDFVLTPRQKDLEERLTVAMKA